MTTTDQAPEAIVPEVLPDPEPAEAPDAPAPLALVEPPAVIVPIPSELATLGQLATTLAAAEAVPSALRNRPNDVFLVLLSARDLGVSLTTALREFHVIDGKVTLSPKVRLAMVRERGHKVWPDPGNDATSATWYAERDGVTYASTFDMAAADRVPARENGKAIKLHEKSNWRAFPQRMFSWRALGYLLDDAFSEVGTGLYSPDELGAVTDEDGVPVIDVTEVDPLPGHKAPRGKAKPAAEPEPLTDEMRANLAGRIAALPVEGRAALRELWTHVNEETGKAALPALADLTGRHLVKAEAMLTSVERRADRGEWGPWPSFPSDQPEAAETPADAPLSAPEGEDAQPPSDPPAAAQGDTGPQPANVLDDAITWVQGLHARQVVLELGSHELATTGNVPTQRRRLAEFLAEHPDILWARIGGTAPE